MSLGSERGNAMIEMTLVGIPLMFTLICIFEISRAMWIYNTMAHGVKDGVRFAVVHGETCVSRPPAINNSCTVTVANIANRILQNGIGISPAETTLVFTPQTGTAITCVMTSCLSNGTQWPPTGSNTVGQRIQIKISAPFRTALGMLWPGARITSFAPFNVGASAAERIRF